MTVVNKLNFKSAVAAVDRSYSRDEESPEEGLDGKTCFDQVAAVSKSFKSNYSRTVKCHNCGFQNMDESINSNENEEIIEPSDMEVSSNTREI